MNSKFALAGRLLPGVIGIGLVALLLGYVEYWRVNRLQQTQLALQSTDLDRRLSRLAVLPRLLSTDPRFVNALAAGTAADIDIANRALAQAKRDSGVAFAFLMNTEGLTVAASNWRDPVSFVGRNYRFRPYFSGAIAGRQSTFFAVGATTGVAGYFIANSVRDGERTVGVIVVKQELDQLLDSWRSSDHKSLLLDELGVVILATDSKLLYSPSASLNERDKQLIDKDRRYRLNEQSRLVDSPFALPALPVVQWRNAGAAGDSHYVSVDRDLQIEPWTLRHLVSIHAVAIRVGWYLLGLSGLIALAVLAQRNHRQQKLMARGQQRNAEQLELQVQARTKELQSAQQALIAQSNFAMLGRMSAAINHEINQPLASLRFNLAALRQLIAAPNASAAQIRDTVIDSDRTTRRIARVIDTLRSVARQRNTRFSLIEFNRLLIDIEQIVRRERPAASVALVVEGPLEAQPDADTQSAQTGAPLLRLYGNEVLLQQALLNLLYNAFDATLQCREPRVSLAWQIGSAQLQIHIQDNGSGVAPETVENLFRPFYTNSKRSSGLGLGLTLAQQIVEDHRGTLLYRAVPAGGSCFTVELPLEPRQVHSD